MNTDSQSTYWDKVANVKTFTHPVDYSWLKEWLFKDAYILDFGCGYGRVVQQLLGAGYKNVIGFDTSQALIGRGRAELADMPIYYIPNAETLPVEDNSQDCILLFAVLTCIPDNNQAALIEVLYRKLRPGGMLYISDYYLQTGNAEAHLYQCLNGNPDNNGVFTLPEGVTFRHHERAWIATLISKFKLLAEKAISVVTMNGHYADAFQIACARPGKST